MKLIHPEACGTARKLGLALALVLAVPVLQGCFPAAVTAASAGALMASDRRTSGAYVEDEGLEWRAANTVRERYGDRVHVNATSYNRILLLTGEVPDAETKEALNRALGGLENLRGLVNEVQVRPNSTLSTRTNDALVTSRVKARLIDDKRLAAHLVKVLTEAGVVFLMGRVTRSEAEVASEVARTTAGVLKVVRVFEYITDEEAHRLDNRLGDTKRAPASEESLPVGS